jgi:pectin methylesterase-like acyl-CoA thioesterase
MHEFIRGILTLPLAVSSLSAATHYVSLGSTNPTQPYTNWATAATSIQAAVNVAAANDAVLVTNGVYPGGVAVTNALTLLTVNGPQFTIINGGRTNLCVYLTGGASLTGFTLTNGYAQYGGGVCGSPYAFLTNCLIVGNSSYPYSHAIDAGYGGGAYGCTLHNCTLSGNSAYYGGGAYGSTLYNCTLTGSSVRTGGGAHSCTLHSCTLSGNSAPQGQGIGGGGAYSSTLYNCTLSGNSARYNLGGGALDCTLYNCTLSGNSAGLGGGASSCALYNCILYYNTASLAVNYDSSCTLNCCCTTPLPTTGVGNLALDPQLASASHLSAGSPCRGAGSAAYVTGADIDGEPWGNPPSIGCDEYHVGAVTGPLTVGILASPTNVPTGYAVSLTALIEGRTTQSVWDFGDGVVVSNRPYTSHAWTAPGEYVVALRGYNEANVAGVSATVTIHVVPRPVVYVAANSPNPQPPYASWATAARNIQDAVNAADSAGAAVLVTNGVYPGNVSVTKPLALLSVNGPQFTIINGGGTDRCVYLTTQGASLTGFTLTNGYNDYEGGGVACASTTAFLTNCLIVGNSAYNGGGGAFGCTLYNSALSGNSTPSYHHGGGAYRCTLYNCTVSGNSGGGVNSCTLYNCIVYYNTAVSGEPNYDASSTLNCCCTTPLPTTGVGNLALDPQLASATYLSAGSPCRGAGNPAYATGTDIDGEPWGNPPSIGCDEYHAGAATGPLTVGLVASETNVPVGHGVSLTALIEGRTTQSVWDFGDGVVVSNRPYASHAWALPADYAVTLRAYNEANVAGVSAIVTIHVVTQPPVVYVAASGPNPQPPYASWATAARSIQAAVNAASFPRAVVLVTNGVYPGNVSVTKPLTLLSVNGPQFTIINGGGTNRCVYLMTEGASLTGFTLTNGYNYYQGGGVACASTTAFLTNCLIVGNSAYTGGGGAFGCTLYNCTLSGNSASDGFGGGAINCTLYNCMLSGNSTSEVGGGAFGCTLYNCTLSGNSASEVGGGAYTCTLYNCIAYYNTALGGANYDSLSSTLIHCCTTPLPTAGVGNIANAPLFVDSANGNLRLQSNSPCINAGNNAYVTTTTDLDGRPRIVGGTVDIGAYEFQPGVSGAFIGWLQGYGLPTDGSADYADSDHDSMNNWQEWVCGTCPTNGQSVLRMVTAVPTASNATVTWQSVAGVNYFLERSADLAASFTLLATNILGQAGTTSYADTNAAGKGPFFYRVGVRCP